MEISDFFESCKNPEPVYLLSGKDHYNTRKIFDFCEEQVEISARSFDWEVYELGEGRKEEIPDLINSIRTKLFTLDEDVTVYPGHMGNTDIGVEKRTNPFCGMG